MEQLQQDRVSVTERAGAERAGVRRAGGSGQVSQGSGQVSGTVLAPRNGFTIGPFSHFKRGKYPRIFLDVVRHLGHHGDMGRPLRTPAGGLVYHALNCANRRAQLFADAGDYAVFVRTLADAQAEHPMRLLAYCVMPNHWHLVLWPEQDGSLSRFAGWLTLTHTQRWHAYRNSAGSGHVYQGRFKSFVIEADAHLLTVSRYVERNALRAGLVRRAEDWCWGSLWQRLHGDADGRPALATGPVRLAADWAEWVNAPQTLAEEAALRRCARRGEPFGSAAWVERTVESFGLHSTRRPPGRPCRDYDAERKGVGSECH
jgi:putative transposase